MNITYLKRKRHKAKMYLRELENRRSLSYGKKGYIRYPDFVKVKNRTLASIIELNYKIKMLQKQRKKK